MSRAVQGPKQQVIRLTGGFPRLPQSDATVGCHNPALAFLPTTTSWALETAEMDANKTLAVAALAAALTTSTLATRALADPATDGKGRYTMTPVEGGFMRLDSETGAVALCTRKGDAWACEPVNDTSAASDAARLEAENKALKDRVKSLEEAATVGKAPVEGGDAPTGAPGGISKLPTEKEVDEALDYVERMYKKFRDRMQSIEKTPNPPAPKPGEGGSGAL
jgi:hypothetical protein